MYLLVRCWCTLLSEDLWVRFWFARLGSLGVGTCTILLDSETGIAIRMASSLIECFFSTKSIQHSTFLSISQDHLYEPTKCQGKRATFLWTVTIFGWRYVDNDKLRTTLDYRPPSSCFYLCSSWWRDDLPLPQWYRSSSPKRIWRGSNTVVG